MYQQEKLTFWQKQVESWGNKVGLYSETDGADFTSQYLYAFAEFGEAVQSHLKGDTTELIDGIGDTFVCIVHAQKFSKNEPLRIMKFRIDEYQDSSVRSILAKVPDYLVKHDFNSVATMLIIISYKLTEKPYECFEQAYNEIKDREGRMVNGVFKKRATLELQGLWEV